jgi:subtilisin family serine protease
MNRSHTFQLPCYTSMKSSFSNRRWLFGSACSLLLGWPFIAATGAGSGNTLPASVDVLIYYTAPPGDAQLEEVRANGGVVYRTFNIVPAVAARVPHSGLELIRKQPEVVAIDPDGRVEAHSESDAAWGLVRIGALPVHAGNFAGATGPVLGTGVKVAVIDTGVDYLHPELAPNFAGGFDFLNNDADPMDDNGHGTHVSGIVVAAQDGVGMLGVAPSASLYALKVLGANGSGSWSGVIAALDWSVMNGISVANLSLGSTIDPGFTVRTAFDNAAKAGVFVVASAGNSGPGVDTVNYPGRFDSVVAVGSTTVLDGLSIFSSTGPSVELSAPGTTVYSTIPGGGYGYLSGTSMAAPHVAGVAALALSSGVPDFNADGYRNDDLRRLLQVTAEDLGPDGRDEGFGFGLVDAKSALIYAKTNPIQIPWFLPPSDLSLVLNKNIVSLVWRDNSTIESGFEIQVGLVKGNTVTWRVWGATNPDSLMFSGTLEKGAYRFRVRAKTGAIPRFTAWSKEVATRVR